MAPPGYGGFGYPPPRPRRRRWPLVVGIVTAVVLLAGLGLGGWAYGTGRLGFGPLSAKDKAAARAIADAADSPTWADDAQRSCAATKLLQHHRSGALQDAGLIERDGDGWRFTGDWDTPDARTYADGLLSCADDWQEQLADAWDLEDTECLGETGRSVVADTLITTELDLDADDAVSVHDAAAERLDDCYGGDLDAVSGTARPADRSVDFRLTAPDAANATTVLTVSGPHGDTTVQGGHYRAETEVGGARVCIDVTARATYPWGSSATSGTTHLCGKAQPRKLWWTKLPHCTIEPGCVTWGLHASGFRTGIATLHLASASGDCPLEGDDCTKTVLIDSDGHGFDDGLVMEITGGPGRRNDDIIARLAGLTSRLHR